MAEIIVPTIGKRLEPDEWHIRHVTKSDLDRVIEIENKHNEYFDELFEAKTVRPYTWTKEAFLAFLNQSNVVAQLLEIKLEKSLPPVFISYMIYEVKKNAICIEKFAIDSTFSIYSPEIKMLAHLHKLLDSGRKERNLIEYCVPESDKETVKIFASLDFKSKLAKNRFTDEDGIYLWFDKNWRNECGQNKPKKSKHS